MLELDVERRQGSFEIRARFATRPGITALFGRSGAGKTSIMQMLAGLVRPDRGRISVNGRVLFDSNKGINLPPHRRGIAYVFQEPRLFPHMSVRKNLLYGRRFRDAAGAIDAERVIGLLGIGHLLDRRPVGLSGGEQQRVAIGRAILAAPGILLMDEPLASLDNARKREILPLIEQLRDELRLPILYVSHALEEVSRLADTMVLLDDGKVVTSGPPEEVLTRLDLRPLTGRWQAGTVVDTTILVHDAESRLTRLGFAGGELRIPMIAEAPGQRLRVRILARDVALARGLSGRISIRNHLPARITDITQESGPFVEVRLDLGGTPLLARITRDAARDLELEEGLEVTALVKSIAVDFRGTGG